MAGTGERRLDLGHRYVYSAVRAVAHGSTLPTPPGGDSWCLRAAQHDVLTVVAAHLAADPSLAPVRRLRAAHHLVAVAELARLREALERVGVEWLLFKGPVLSELVYRRPGARGYSDLDVLVRKEDVEVAAAALHGIGAPTIDEGWRAMMAIGDGETTHCTASGIMIDLHWDVVNDRRQRPAFAMDTDGLFARARSVVVAGVPVRTFDPVDTLLHVALHACLSGADRLRWLLDVQQCALACADRVEEVRDRAAELEVHMPLSVMAMRVARHLDDALARRLAPTGAGVAARAWLAADAAVAARNPPGARHEGRVSGALIPMSTRSDGWQSMRTAVAAAPQRIEGHVVRGLGRVRRSRLRAV